ncbi:AraC family transcriptional regulator [Ornithinimicrobium humiphilum]
MAAYDMSLGAPGVHRGLPSPALTLVLPLGEAIDVGWSGAPATRAPRRSLLSGLHVAPAAIHHDGHQTGVQLMLTTSGARALLGLPAAALSRELVELDQLDAIAGAPQLRSLPERLHAEDDQEELLRLTETALLAGLSRHDGPGPRPEVARAQRALRHGIPVSEVAVEVGWSRRHLSEQFRAECGIGPKEYQRIARFQGSVRLLLEAGRAGRVRLADVAADAGYADQSHLTREWTALAGCTPTRWLAEEFPFVQDWRGEVDDDRP